MGIIQLKLGKLLSKRLFIITFAACLCIFLLVIGIKSYQDFRGIYAVETLMMFPRAELNPNLVNSTLAKRPELLREKDKYGWTIMHWSSLWCRRKVVDILLANGADVNIKTTNRGFTPLHLVARHPFEQGSEEMVRFLIAHGADVNSKNNSAWTPLHFAAASGDESIFKLLVASGARVNAIDFNCDNPLHIAVKYASFGIVKQIVDSGVKVDAQNDGGWTPLHFAAWKGRKDVVELLISSGADLNLKNNNDQSPLNIAVENGNSDIAEIFRNHKEFK